jgi:integrating conjugative element protein (TIGR03755 family)
MNFKKSLLPMAITIALSGPTFAAVEFNTKSKDELLKNPIAGIEKQSRLYYKIGGARPISTPPVDYSEINVGGDLKFGAGYSCGKFDPTLSLQNFMNNLKDGADDAMNTMANAATSAIASLPALFLQRNSPDIYELLQTNTFRAEEKYKFNATSCQQMESQIAKGENPYKQWTMFAQSTELKEETESNPDANEAMEKVKESGGDKGVYFPVPGEGIVKAGGVGQQPIRVVEAATTVGYNTITRQSNITQINAPSGVNEASPLVKTFKTPKELSDWTQKVIGEKDVYTTTEPSSTPKYTAGQGILVQADKQKQQIQPILIKALKNNNPEEQYQAINELPAGTAGITVGLIKKLNNTDPEIKGNVIDALASEMALNTEINKAILARRALIASLSEPNISSAQSAKEEINNAIAMIEKEIERSMFEYRLRKELVSGVTQAVLEQTQAPGEETLTPEGTTFNPKLKQPGSQD